VFAGYAAVLRGNLSAYVSFSLVRDRSNREKRWASGTRRRRQRNTLRSDDQHALVCVERDGDGMCVGHRDGARW
jgi:hypothetical protein